MASGTRLLNTGHQGSLLSVLGPKSVPGLLFYSCVL